MLGVISSVCDKFLSNNTSIKFKSFFKISPKNRNSIIFTLYVYITLVFCPYLDNLFNELLDNDPFFFVYVTFIGLGFNYVNSKYTKDFSYINIPVFSYPTKFLVNIGVSFIFINFRKFFLFFRNNVIIVGSGVCYKLKSYVMSFFIL